jgi:Tol biopolymer transport system component
VSRRRPVSWLPWAVAAVFAVVAAATLLRPGAPKTLPVVTRFSIPPPANGVFVSGGVEGTTLAVSPDGSQIAYVASDREAGRRIWLRPMSALEGRPVGGTKGARSLFWSPDSRSVGLFVEDKLKRVDLSGDAPVTICDVPAGTGFSGTWGTGGDILFAAVQGEAIYRVSAAGGTPTRILQVDRAHGEARCNWPWFLPDGRRFLYLRRTTAGSSSVMLFTPGSPPTAVLPVASKAQYADPGFLVFVREGVLLAQRFDSARGRVVGEPFSVAPTVRYFLSSGYAAFGLSQSGPLIYQSQSDVMRLVWFDRAGRQLGILGPPGGYQVVAFSRDGRRVVFDRRRDGIGTFGIWSADLERGTETPVTAGPDTEAQPILLPGEKSIAYSRVRGGPPQLVRHDLATGKVEELVPPGAFQLATDVSPDGKTLLYAERGPGGVFDLWTLPLAGDGKPVPFLVSPSTKREARFSPDGRFVGLVSTESGRPEVYVTAYPGPGERIRISTEGADLLRWSRAGDLVYMSLSGSLVSVAVRTSPSLEIGKPKVLFKVEQDSSWYAFNVSPDGNRFLAVVPELIADQLPLTVVANWTSGAHK